MILAIASGKGGTGKTTVALNLAHHLPRPVRLLDCDAEAPNCHLFLHPTWRAREPVCQRVPVVDESRCSGCGKCAEICRFHAIMPLKTRPLIFSELCHGCGGCIRVCPTGALTETDREIGVVETAETAFGALVQGRLHVGKAMSPPVIRAVKRHVAKSGVTLIDCPPGTSCPMVAAVKGCDYVLLVTEPTPFGLHDLTLAVETLRALGLPFGVVINRSDIGDERTRRYCSEEGIPLLLEIPFDRRVAEAYSRGILPGEAVQEMRERFDLLAEQLLARKTERVERSGETHANL